MPTGIGTAIVMGGLSTGAAALGFTTVIGGSLMTHFLVTTAMGAAINALTPKPSSVSSQSGYNVTSTSSVADHQIIYGMTKVAGVRVFDHTTGDSNKYLHRVIAFTGHEIESFHEIYINDELVTLDGNGNVTSPSRYDGFVRIKAHLGADDQLADTDLVSEVTDWTTDHKLSGVAYLYIRYQFSQDAFPNGVPEVTAVIKGKKVYDPRTDTTAWSDNPALCIRDYLTNSRYGLGESTDNIDDNLFIVAANVCDYYNYPTLTGDKRYTANGSFTTAASPYDLLNNILSSMGGLLWYAQGKWRVKPAYWTSPALLLTEDDLRSSISVSTRHSRRDNFNTVNGVWKGADSNWQTTDFPPVTNTDFVTADNGQEKNTDLNLSFTSDVDMARRIANIYLERNRQQLTVQASFGMKAFQVQVGDVVQLSNSRFGWNQKEFEVVSWTFGLVDNNDLQVHMTLREISQSVFDDYSDGVIYERDNTTLASPFDVPTPSLDAAVVTSTVNNDGTTVPQIKFSWSVTDATSVDKYDFQWKLSTDSTWNSIDLVATEFVLSPALSGRAYNYRVRAVNHLGVRSAFVSSPSPASTGDDGTTPNAPTSVSASGGYASATVTWSAPTQNTDSSPLKDLFQYKVYRGTSTNPTTLIGRVSGEIFTDSGLLDNTTYYYRVKAVDFTGNESAYSSNASVTTKPQLVDGVDGIDGSDGNTVALLTVYKRSATTPATPTGGSFNFDTLTLTAPSGWYTSPPSGTDPVYVSVATASIIGTSGTDNSLTWANPSQLVQNGADGADGVDGADGLDGTAGKSVYTAIVFQRAASAPSAPTGGSFNFGTNTLTPPTNWYLDVPSGSDPIYGTRFVFSIIGDTGSQTATTWATPFRIAENGVDGLDGVDGADGLSTYLASVFKRSASAPTTPTGGSYNFGTNTLTAPSGWSVSVPSGSDPLYVSTALASVQGVSGTDSTLTWTSPKVLAQNGADGVDGASVLVVYADDAVGTNQSLTAGSRQYVQYVEYTTTVPTLPVSGTFVKFVGDDGSTGQGIYPIYADDAAGNNQSFDPTGKTYVTFYEATIAPTLPVSGQTFVRYVGNDGADGADGANGVRGAGRWHIGVTTLPTTSSGAHTDFTNALFDPVDNDQAWFYTGTQSNPTSQTVWIYSEGSGATPADSWALQDEVIDGNLVVAGTITADRLVSTQLSSLGMTIGTLSSAPSGERVVISDTQILVYDSNNIVRVKIGDLA